MIHTLNHRQDITTCENTKLKSTIVPFEDLIMDNGGLPTKTEYDNRSNINFQLHHAFNQDVLNTDLLDEVILTELILRPTKKPRSVGPHKSISKKNGNTRKSRLGNKKFRSVCKPLYEITADPNIIIGLKSPRHLLYKSKDRNKYPIKNASRLIPINWKFTKKQLRIIRDISTPDCIPHYGLSHRFGLKTDSPRMSDKDKRLLYSLIERLLFISETTVSQSKRFTPYNILKMHRTSTLYAPYMHCTSC